MGMSEEKIERNERIAKARFDAGLSINEITLNPNYNVDGLTPQRISAICKHVKRKYKTESA